LDVLIEIVYIRVFIGVSARTYMTDYLRLYCFLEKKCFVPSAGFVQSQWKKAMKKSLSRALRNEVDRDDSGLKTSQSMSTDKGA
jgi:hypothetical protein